VLSGAGGAGREERRSAGLQEWLKLLPNSPTTTRPRFAALNGSHARARRQQAQHTRARGHAAPAAPPPAQGTHSRALDGPVLGELLGALVPRPNSLAHLRPRVGGDAGVLASRQGGGRSYNRIAAPCSVAAHVCARVADVRVCCPHGVG